MPHATAGRALIRMWGPALLCLAVGAMPAAAQIYKWVDEKGRTHYSENPPPEGKASTKVAPPPPPPSGGSGSATRESPEAWKEKDAEWRRRRLERGEAEDKARRRGEQEAARRRDACRRAQRELHILQAGPVYSVNERGERVYLEDKDRPAAIAAARKLVDANCADR